MAFKLTVSIPPGHDVARLVDGDAEMLIRKVDTTLENAYLRISDVDGDKNQLKITVQVLPNAESSVSIMDKVYYFVPSVEDGAPNYHKQGYEHLKTLPEFSGAIDC